MAAVLIVGRGWCRFLRTLVSDLSGSGFGIVGPLQNRVT
jgi:hypothetical protein